VTDVVKSVGARDVTFRGWNSAICYMKVAERRNNDRLPRRGAGSDATISLDD